MLVSGATYNWTQFNYDAAGNLTEIMDAQGRVLTVLSPEGQVLQTNTYDMAGRLLQRLDGMGGGVKYEYDLAGDQRRITTMGGASQELEYDARGRITGINKA